jgi:hypothetical protein
MKHESVYEVWHAQYGSLQTASVPKHSSLFITRPGSVVVCVSIYLYIVEDR